MRDHAAQLLQRAAAADPATSFAVQLPDGSQQRFGPS